MRPNFILIALISFLLTLVGEIESLRIPQTITRSDRGSWSLGVIEGRGRGRVETVEVDLESMRREEKSLGFLQKFLNPGAASFTQSNVAGEG